MAGGWISGLLEYFFRFTLILAMEWMKCGSRVTGKLIDYHMIDCFEIHKTLSELHHANKDV